MARSASNNADFSLLISTAIFAQNFTVSGNDITGRVWLPIDLFQSRLRSSVSPLSGARSFHGLSFIRPRFPLRRSLPELTTGEFIAFAVSDAAAVKVSTWY